MSQEFRKHENGQSYPITPRKARHGSKPAFVSQEDATYKASRIRTDAMKDYVQGTINKASYDRKIRAANKLSAPPKSDILRGLEQRAHAEGKSLSSERDYNGWTNWDTWATMLALDNTQKTSRWLDSWSENFNRKIKAGTFNSEEAEKVVSKYLVPVARGSKKMWFGQDFTPEPDISLAKVNKAEIVHNIVERNTE